MESSLLGAYWGRRRESSLECGERLARCLSALAEVDDALGSWYQRGPSKATARAPVELAAEPLGNLLARGVNRRDVGGDPIPELGFSVGLWNRATPTVGLSATVGGYPTSPGLLNSFVLKFPSLEEGGTLYEPENAAVIMDAVVEAWEPEWASWTTHRLLEAQAVGPREPVIGWMTYLSALAPKDDESSSTFRALAKGGVFRIARDFSDVDEPSVLAARRHLERMAVLHPIP